jgi:branched-chain amino acid transport system permease protein
MLIMGGSGRNLGAMLGAFLIWAIWSMTELLTNRLPPEWLTRASYVRVLLIGLLLQIVLQRFPGGLAGECPRRR